MYTAIDLTTCCEGRTSYGGPTKASVMKQVELDVYKRQVMHGFALFKGVELQGTCADNLENDGHGASLTVKAGDGPVSYTHLAASTPT